MSKKYLEMINHPSRTKEIPVWMMRQAGRYLPEYRAIRSNHSFLDMVYNPEVAAEITLQPIRRYGFDAAILFSDILVTPQALGMDLTFTEGKGPQFSSPIQSESSMNDLSVNMTVLEPIYETIRILRRELPEQTTLIGFAGAPFTVASYMIEGGTSKDLKTTKKMMIQNPTLFENILNKVTLVTIDYLENQVKAGAEALQIFDTWISQLDWVSCDQFSATYVKRIISELRNRGVNCPITFFGKNTSLFFPLYESTGVDIISFDWCGDLARIDQQLKPGIGMQGNLDPFILFGPEVTIQHHVERICNSVKSDRPFIFNLGHGLMPDIPVEAVEQVIAEIRNHSARF
jgi:uroporphyrinogen decarboxylase